LDWHSFASLSQIDFIISQETAHGKRNRVEWVINNETGTTRAYVDGKMRHEQKFATGDTPGTPTGISVGGTPEDYQ